MGQAGKTGFGRWKAGTDNVFAVRLCRVEGGLWGQKQSQSRFSAVVRFEILPGAVAAIRVVVEFHQRVAIIDLHC
jgi:hypothetical protein